MSYIFNITMTKPANYTFDVKVGTQIILSGTVNLNANKKIDILFKDKSISESMVEDILKILMELIDSGDF